MLCKIMNEKRPFDAVQDSYGNFCWSALEFRLEKEQNYKVALVHFNEISH